MGNPFAIQRNTDGTIKDLPLGAKLSNALGIFGQWFTNPLLFSACAQWVINSYRARKMNSVAWPVRRIVIFNYLTGTSCAEVSIGLRAFGIPTQTLSIFCELWPDRKGIGLKKAFLVPAKQAAMADDILRHHYTSEIDVVSAPLGTGAKFTRPSGAWAKPRSWDEAITAAMYGFYEGMVMRTLRHSADVSGKKLPTKRTENKPKSPIKTGKQRKQKSSVRKSVGKRIVNTIWRA